MYNRKNKMWKYIEFALLDTFKIQLNACYAMVLMLPSLPSRSSYNNRDIFQM